MKIVKQGEILKNIIRGRGMLIKDAAALLNMSRENLQYYLTKNTFDADFRIKIKTALGVDLDSVDKGVIHDNDYSKLSNVQKVATIIKQAIELENYKQHSQKLHAKLEDLAYLQTVNQVQIDSDNETLASNEQAISNLSNDLKDLLGSDYGSRDIDLRSLLDYFISDENYLNTKKGYVGPQTDDLSLKDKNLLESLTTLHNISASYLDSLQKEISKNRDLEGENSLLKKEIEQLKKAK